MKESKKPLVSVIVPAYNAAPYITETLDSICASNYSNIEVIIVDDGSKDNTHQIVESYIKTHSQIKYITQKNQGSCIARNHAIRESNGKYILPVDADDLISPQYISLAVEVLENNENIKVVRSQSAFFGTKNKKWKLHNFSPQLLARKNHINISAVYRKSDWEKVEGYDSEIITREDWAFWIALFKTGGHLITLPHLGFFYRLHPHSKRNRNRKKLKQVIAILNRKHPSFFYKHLGGPLRKRRSLSKIINFFSKLKAFKSVHISEKYIPKDAFLYILPESFSSIGETIYKGRNELKILTDKQEELIVKSYKRPHFFNQIIYGWIRKSKAERSFLYATLLRKIGIGTPEPIAYINQYRFSLLSNSFFITKKSSCEYTFRDFSKKEFNQMEKILIAIAKTTANMHKAGLLHKDYSAGNILFNDDPSQMNIEIVDLNRIKKTTVGIEEGCKNFERLRLTPTMVSIIAKTYAKERGFDTEKCTQLITKYGSKYTNK